MRYFKSVNYDYFLHDEDTRKQPGQVIQTGPEQEDLLEYIRKRIMTLKGSKQPLVSNPPYRGNLLEYIEKRLKEEGIIKKGR